MRSFFCEYGSFKDKNTYQATYAYKIKSISTDADEELNRRGYYLYELNSLPWKFHEPVTEVPISMKELLSQGTIKTERFLRFKKYIRIYYIPNYDKDYYPFNFNIKNIPNIQSSIIELERDSVMVDIKGRYYDKFGIHTYGTFGQERVSDMLPYEYEYTTE